MTAVFVTVDGDATETTLDRFIDANEFDPAEVAAIRTDVCIVGCYRGGGGAAPEWLVCTPDYLRRAAA